MKKDFKLTPDLNKFVCDANIQPIEIGCSGDTVLKISKGTDNFFIKYSANPNIETEYKNNYNI